MLEILEHLELEDIKPYAGNVYNKEEYLLNEHAYLYTLVEFCIFKDTFRIQSMDKIRLSGDRRTKQYKREYAFITSVLRAYEQLEKFYLEQGYAPYQAKYIRSIEMYP